jgi:hypothetical protein
MVDGFVQALANGPPLLQLTPLGIEYNFPFVAPKIAVSAVDTTTAGLPQICAPVSQVHGPAPPPPADTAVPSLRLISAIFPSVEPTQSPAPPTAGVPATEATRTELPHESAPVLRLIFTNFAVFPSVLVRPA